jgi:hypothetical protein
VIAVAVPKAEDEDTSMEDVEGRLKEGVVADSADQIRCIL